jgi:hypothetical protein
MRSFVIGGVGVYLGFANRNRRGLVVALLVVLVAGCLMWLYGTVVRARNVWYAAADDAGIAAICVKRGAIVKVRTGTSDWASALAGCIDKHGGHATIERNVDIATGATTYSVRWPTRIITTRTSATNANVTTESGATIKEPSSAP